MMQKWIKASERLPENGQRCWIVPLDDLDKRIASVYDSDMHRFIFEHYDDYIYCFNYQYIERVLYWIPSDLPELPEG